MARRKKIVLSEIPTTAPAKLDKKTIKKETKKIAEEIADLVKIMSANKKYSLLVVLQGMDSSGKDGVSKAVFSATPPTMVSAYSFKKPSDEEFAHDFLWRAHKQVPAKGEVKIFVRSHYEDVLIQRVHNWINKKKVDNRINSINAFENLLVEDNDTIVMKFYLHLSKARQKEKLTERIEDPEKNFKHNDGDWEERKHWRKYMNAYQDVINRSDLPWHITPADSRWYRNYYVATKVLAKLKSLKENYPALKEPPQIDYKNA